MINFEVLSRNKLIYDLWKLNVYVTGYWSKLLLKQIISLLLSGNHYYNTKSKDTTNTDEPDLVSALFKVEYNLLQSITNLKDGVSI